MTLERYALLGYGQNGYDLATRLLWLEISLPSLGPRLPQRGLAALRRRGHQHLYVQTNRHVHSRAVLLFPRIVPGDSRFRGRTLDRLERRASLRPCVWLDVYLLEYHHGKLLRTRGVPETQRHRLHDRGDFLFARRRSGGKNFRPLSQLQISV